MRSAIMLLTGVSLICWLIALGKEAKVVSEWTVKVRTGEQALKAVVLSTTVHPTKEAKGAVVIGEQTYSGQVTSLPDGQVKVTWLEAELPAKSEKVYRLRLTDEPQKPSIKLTAEERWVAVSINGQIFTRYYFSDVPKPFCFPLIGPNGKHLTRGFPIEPREGETRDHSHHKGFWVGYGDVNGYDLWAERGKIIHRSFEAMESGSVFGLLRARSEWCAPDGKKLCEEVRELRIYALPTMRILDLTMTFTATDSDLVFGDTKEGFVAIRIPDELTVTRGTGKIVNSEGQKDKEAWGKRAKWCLYYGSVKGEPVAISFFDHPKNLSYPTPWHVRDYGLFANGPFGRKDFGLPPEEPVRIPKGQSLTLHYRIILHAGVPTTDEVNAAWSAFAHPPQVK